MSNRTILITGSTNGIGFRTAEILLQLEQDVIIASRSLEKVNATVEKLQKKFINSRVFGYALDLSSLSSVANFSEKLYKDFKSLDVLILNAGTAGNITSNNKIDYSNEGFEQIFATNHLGHFYLVELLIPLLKGSPARIVVLSSGTHDPKSGSGTPPPNNNIKDLPNPAKYDCSVAYASSKLANALHGNYMSRHLDPSQITVATYDPGFIGDTGLLSSLGKFQPIVKVLINTSIAATAWWRGIPNQNSTLDRSTSFLVKLALDLDLVSETGSYYSIDRKHNCSEDASNVALQEELIEFSRELLNSKGFTSK
jgi:NAD(P)-dependent dehydrogenase (short-subunit alcohol dehydrogenase family)